MSRLASAVVAAVAIAVCSNAALAGGRALVPISPPKGGYTILLPAGWQLTQKGHSKHGPDVWRDPTDPQASVDVTLSSCAKCVTSKRGKSPDLTRVLPRPLSSTTPVSRWQVLFLTKAKHRGYPDNGTIIVTHVGNRITGYVRIDAVLPPDVAVTATAILVSFQPG